MAADKIDFSSCTSLELAIDSFLSCLKSERRLSSHTCRNYQHAVKAFASWYKSISGSEMFAHEVQIEDARSYIIECQNKISRITLRNHISGLRNFFKFCMERGFCKNNPFHNLVLPKTEKNYQNSSQKRSLLSLLSSQAFWLLKADIQNSLNFGIK